MKKFVNIKSIDPNDKKTWKGKIAFSTDIDWAPDHVLEWAYEFIDSLEIPVTWFITHNNPINNKILENDKFDYGIHPNFNPELLGYKEGNSESFEEKVKNLFSILGPTKLIRMHSNTSSNALYKDMAKLGFTHECNSLLPGHLCLPSNPWPTWNNIIKVPHSWADDIACNYEDLLGHSKNISYTKEGINYITFHPIHMWLNTRSTNHYQAYKNKIPYDNICLDKIGCRDVLLNFLSKIQS